MPPAAGDLAATVALLQRRLERERNARKSAEQLLTAKSRELYAALQDAQQSERRLNMALWATGEGIWEWEPAAGQVAISGLQLGSTLLPHSKVTMAALLARVHADDADAVREALEQHAADGDRPIDQKFRVRQEEQWYWVRVRGRALQRDAQQRARQVTGTIRDVSTQHDAEQLAQMLAHAFASTMDALLVLDPGWTVAQGNAASAALLGCTADSLVGQDLLQLLQLRPPLTRPKPWRGEASLLASSHQPADAVALQPVFEVAITRVAVARGQVPQHLVALRDVSEQRRAELALQRMALYDTLTGLANRALINQHLAERLARPDSPTFWLMFIDLDGFKGVNDSFGHRAGDQLLQQAAERLRQVLPESFIGRWGGDEFLVALPDGADDYMLRESAQLIIATLGQPFMVDGHRLSVTPSIGAVNHPVHGSDAQLLLRRADAAMYGAKAQGRNCLVLYAPKMDDGVERRSRLQGLIRVDAERNAFHFVVQPKVDAAGRSTGAEVLMRWTTSEFGAVPPTEFIPIAEQIGVIPLMGRHALHAAARLARMVRDLGSQATVAVNLSPRQLLRPDLERTVLHACEHHGISPPQLELEMTESALVSDIAGVARLLKRLRRHGFRLSLDDFGTGYSSLSHLRDLPFDKVKIDRSFVSDLGSSIASQVLLQGVVQLCGRLGLKTVAEGVETSEQFALLRSFGVNEFQGYLFARPQEQADWLDGLQQQLAAPR
jgi:diguanylate cyclase (GGDEF)-like protein